MSETEQTFQAILDTWVPSGTPDKDHTQTRLTELLILDLLRPNCPYTSDESMKQFAEQYEPQLQWIGTTRQDAIIKDAMASTGIDLSRWLEPKRE
jgi:hypothetical protein